MVVGQMVPVEEPAELFDVSPMPLMAPVYTIPKCTTYIPTMLDQKLVVQKVSELGHTGYGMWETTNEYLQGDTDGLNYRLSTQLAHTHTPKSRWTPCPHSMGQEILCNIY